MKRQTRILKSSVAASKAAALAAQKSADVAISSTRAWIITSDVRFSSDWPDIADQGAPTKSKMIVQLHNAGASPAEITRARVVSVLWPSEFLLNKTPLYGESEAKYAIGGLPGTIIAADEKHWVLCRIHDVALLTPEQRQGIRSGEQKLICYGMIEYKDVSGTDRITQFGYEYHIRLLETDDKPETMYRMPSREYNHTT